MFGRWRDRPVDTQSKKSELFVWTVTECSTHCGPDIKFHSCFITSRNRVRAPPQPENFIPSCFFNVVLQLGSVLKG